MVLEINKINIFQVHRHQYHQVLLVINKQDSSFRVDGGEYFVAFFFFFTSNQNGSYMGAAEINDVAI